MKNGSKSKQTIDDKWAELVGMLREEKASELRIVAMKSAFYGGVVALTDLLADAKTPQAMDHVVKTTMKSISACFNEIKEQEQVH